MLRNDGDTLRRRSECDGKPLQVVFSAIGLVPTYTC